MPCSNSKKEHGDIRLLIKTENKRKLLVNYGEEQYDWILKKGLYYCDRFAGNHLKDKYVFSLDKNLFKINKIDLNLNAKMANIRNQA